MSDPLSKAEYIKQVIVIPSTLRNDLLSQGIDPDTAIADAVEIEYQYYLATFSHPQ